MCLIHDFLTRIEFDLWNIMLEHMAKVQPYGAHQLFYPSMITQLQRIYHVEEEYHYDRMIPVSRIVKTFDW